MLTLLTAAGGGTRDEISRRLLEADPDALPTHDILRRCVSDARQRQARED